MSARFLCLAMIGALLVSPAATAADYWVAPGGRDGGRGQKSAPWSTLQYAASQVRPGDTVHVVDGDYKGFYTEHGGTPDAQIVFLAEGDKVRIVSRNKETQDGINVEGTSYITVDGFVINGMIRAGIRGNTAKGFRVRRVRADSNGLWGIFTSHCDDAVIEYNVTSRSRKEHGIYVSNSGDRPIIRGNISYGNKSCGIHMNGDLSQGGDGTISGAVVDSNTIYGNKGGSAINADGVQDSTFVNNLIFDNHARGISLFKEDAAAPSTNNLIAHNTIVMAADARWAINIKNGSTGNKLFNNIILHPGSARGDVLIVPDSLSGFTSDRNIFHGRFSTDDGERVLDLTKWRAETGQDTHSIFATADTLFVDSQRGDFHLRPASPAIDAADPARSPKSDREGRPRDVGVGPDVGALESAGPKK